MLLSVDKLEIAMEGSFLDRNTTASVGDRDFQSGNPDPRPHQDQAHVLPISGMKHTAEHLMGFPGAPQFIHGHPRSKADMHLHSPHPCWYRNPSPSEQRSAASAATAEGHGDLPPDTDSGSHHAGGQIKLKTFRVQLHW